MLSISNINLEYKSYERQRCFVAYSPSVEWSEDLNSACANILPKFNLEPYYTTSHFDPTQPLRHKIVEIIANSRYGIYDISSWPDTQKNWHIPRNVFIELGIAIALNRPTLLLRHSSNHNLSLPNCLHGVEIIEFTGDITLKKELEKRIPKWLDVSPERDWLNRFCIFGNCVCSFREQHPYSQQWEQKIIHCHISDGFDKNHSNYCKSEHDEIRGIFDEIFSRYSDLELNYLDEKLVIGEHQFLVCSYCQTVRTTPFAIYRISSITSAETFISIGISIALEYLSGQKIPKIFLTRQENELPSLLRGYDVLVASSSRETKQKLKKILPKVFGIVRKKSLQSKPLPFKAQLIDPQTSSAIHHAKQLADRQDFETHIEAQWQRLIQVSSPLSLILCDIDYFESYNKQYGYHAGNNCLIRVSQTLNEITKNLSAFTAHYGGGVFTITLPMTDTERAHQVAREVHKSLRALAIPYESSKISSFLTISTGIATVVPSTKLSPQDLFQAAELAVNHSKQQGRDRIYVHAHYYIHSPSDS